MVDLPRPLAAEFFISPATHTRNDTGAVLMAQRGDAVQLARGSKAKLGLVAMHGFEVLLPYRDGILRVPMSEAVRAWHV